MRIPDEPADRCRRTFFRNLLFKDLDHAEGVREELRGRTALRLSDIGELPDEFLRNATPVFSKDIAHELTGSTLQLRYRAGGSVFSSLRLADEDVQIINLFDRGLTLWQVAERLRHFGAFDIEATYHRVKRIFLVLARAGVCHPAETLTQLRNG